MSNTSSSSDGMSDEDLVKLVMDLAHNDDDDDHSDDDSDESPDGRKYRRSHDDDDVGRRYGQGGEDKAARVLISGRQQTSPGSEETSPGREREHSEGGTALTAAAASADRGGDVRRQIMMSSSNRVSATSSSHTNCSSSHANQTTVRGLVTSPIAAGAAATSTGCVSSSSTATTTPQHREHTEEAVTLRNILGDLPTSRTSTTISTASSKKSPGAGVGSSLSSSSSLSTATRNRTRQQQQQQQQQRSDSRDSSVGSTDSNRYHRYGDLDHDNSDYDHGSGGRGRGGIRRKDASSAMELSRTARATDDAIRRESSLGSLTRDGEYINFSVDDEGIGDGEDNDDVLKRHGRIHTSSSVAIGVTSSPSSSPEGAEETSRMKEAFHHHQDVTFSSGSSTNSHEDEDHHHHYVHRDEQRSGGGVHDVINDTAANEPDEKSITFSITDNDGHARGVTASSPSSSLSEIANHDGPVDDSRSGGDARGGGGEGGSRVGVVNDNTSDRSCDYGNDGGGGGVGVTSTLPMGRLSAEQLLQHQAGIQYRENVKQQQQRQQQQKQQQQQQEQQQQKQQLQQQQQQQQQRQQQQQQCPPGYDPEEQGGEEREEQPQQRQKDAKTATMTSTPADIIAVAIAVAPTSSASPVKTTPTVTTAPTAAVVVAATTPSHILSSSPSSSSTTTTTTITTSTSNKHANVSTPLYRVFGASMVSGRVGFKDDDDDGDDDENLSPFERKYRAAKRRLAAMQALASTPSPDIVRRRSGSRSLYDDGDGDEGGGDGGGGGSGGDGCEMESAAVHVLSSRMLLSASKTYRHRYSTDSNSRKRNSTDNGSGHSGGGVANITGNGIATSMPTTPPPSSPPTSTSTSTSTSSQLGQHARQRYSPPVPSASSSTCAAIQTAARPPVAAQRHLKNNNNNNNNNNAPSVEGSRSFQEQAPTGFSSAQLPSSSSSTFTFTSSSPSTATSVSMTSHHPSFINSQSTATSLAAKLPVTSTTSTSTTMAGTTTYTSPTPTPSSSSPPPEDSGHTHSLTTPASALALTGRVAERAGPARHSILPSSPSSPSSPSLPEPLCYPPSPFPTVTGGETGSITGVVSSGSNDDAQHALQQVRQDDRTVVMSPSKLQHDVTHDHHYHHHQAYTESNTEYYDRLAREYAVSEGLTGKGQETVDDSDREDKDDNDDKEDNYVGGAQDRKHERWHAVRQGTRLEARKEGHHREEAEEEEEKEEEVMRNSWVTLRKMLVNAGFGSSIPRSCSASDKTAAVTYSSKGRSKSGYEEKAYPKDVMEMVRSVLNQHQERGLTIEHMSMEIRSRRAADRVSSDSVEMERLQKEDRNLRKALTQADSKVELLTEELETQRRNSAKEARSLESKVTNLSNQLKQSEHRVKAKETVMQRLIAKLHGEVDKEKATKEKERDMFRRLQHGDPRQRNVADTKLMEVISVYEKGKERMTAEIQSLRAEVRELGEQLRMHENFMFRKSKGGGGGNDDVIHRSNRTVKSSKTSEDGQPASDGSGDFRRNDYNGGSGDGEAERWSRLSSPPPSSIIVSREELANLRERLGEAERSVKSCRAREAKLQMKMTELEDRRGDLQTLLTELQEERGNMELELKSRPTARQWRSCQKEVKELQIKLADGVMQCKEANNVKELRRWLDTRHLIQKDRQKYRMGLNKLDALPSEVAKEIISDLCITLSTNDAAMLGPAVRKLIQVVQVVPRLENFVNTVCSIALRHEEEITSGVGEKGSNNSSAGNWVVGGGGGGFDVMGPAWGGAPQMNDFKGRQQQQQQQRRRPMEDVLEVIDGWAKSLRHLNRLQNFKHQVSLLLSKRHRQLPRQHQQQPPADPSDGPSVAGPDSPLNDKAMLMGIASLLELENKFLSQGVLYARAEEALRGDPDLLVNRIVKHFKYLFGVKKMEGVLPKLNEVYLFVSESENFVTAVRDMLGLSAGAPHNAVLLNATKIIRRVYKLEMKKRKQEEQHQRHQPQEEEEQEERCEAEAHHTLRVDDEDADSGEGKRICEGGDGGDGGGGGGGNGNAAGGGSAGGGGGRGSGDAYAGEIDSEEKAAIVGGGGEDQYRGGDVVQEAGEGEAEAVDIGDDSNDDGIAAPAVADDDDDDDW